MCGWLVSFNGLGWLLNYHIAKLQISFFTNKILLENRYLHQHQFELHAIRLTLCNSKIGTVLLVWFLGVKQRPKYGCQKCQPRLTPDGTRCHSTSIRNSWESDGYSANHCHAVLWIRAHQGHQKENQMTRNEPIGFFFVCQNGQPNFYIHLTNNSLHVITCRGDRALKTA